jgi:predicted nucleic acid-binding protein
MIVVSNTSPPTALLTVGQSDILQKLFDEVIVPEAVRVELLRSHPRLPEWLHVTGIKDTARVKNI